MIYHVVNRANGRLRLFKKDDDFIAFLNCVTVLRYVERNPLRAKMVRRAEKWKWSSLHARMNPESEDAALLSDWPIDCPRDWAERVNQPQTDAEVEALRISLQRGRPFGSDRWITQTASRYHLQSTLRSRGGQHGRREKNDERDNAAKL